MLENWYEKWPECIPFVTSVDEEMFEVSPFNVEDLEVVTGMTYLVSRHDILGFNGSIGYPPDDTLVDELMEERFELWNQE